MKDPIRFLDDASDADELERAVLGAGFEPAPTKSIEDQVLARILASAALVPAVAAVDHGLKAAGAVKTSIGLGVAKGFAVGVAICGAVSGAHAIAAHMHARTEPAPTHAPASPASRSSSNVAAREIIPEAVSIPAAPTNVAPSAPVLSSASAASVRAASPSPSVPVVAALAEDRPVAAAHVSELEAEARALRDARAAMRAGKLTSARTLLEESAARFSSPTLYQEREALMIELLVRDGQVSEARRRAHSFLEQFPESPHAGRVKQLAGTP